MFLFNTNRITVDFSTLNVFFSCSIWSRTLCRIIRGKDVLVNAACHRIAPILALAFTSLSVGFVFFLMQLFRMLSIPG